MVEKETVNLVFDKIEEMERNVPSKDETDESQEEIIETKFNVTMQNEIVSQMLTKIEDLEDKLEGSLVNEKTESTDKEMKEVVENELKCVQCDYKANSNKGLESHKTKKHGKIT